ncbi:hypothetical protein E2562_016183 [Oryza meyeriana var. granulata]|uniref:Uncharacterized protein n=1 Tax=Oryza meyeriana var. granulata TaxID=110450 RepID=A0A6G1CQB5_9ORYZ|nr:hypothetical protein E2562_016183 [Oryza meyeriana var. granulata]
MAKLMQTKTQEVTKQDRFSSSGHAQPSWLVLIGSSVDSICTIKSGSSPHRMKLIHRPLLLIVSIWY